MVGFVVGENLLQRFGAFAFGVYEVFGYRFDEYRSLHEVYDGFDVSAFERFHFLFEKYLIDEGCVDHIIWVKWIAVR